MTAPSVCRCFYCVSKLPVSVTLQVLLTSDKAAANFSDRSLLKNLGHWLGMITLAKNKPILYTVRIPVIEPGLCSKLSLLAHIFNPFDK